MKICNKIPILQLILYRVKISALAILSINLAFISGCTSAIEIVKKVRSPQFKIQSINDLKIAGINITDKKSVSELTGIEKSQLSEAIASKKLPSSFTLNILARNPNDGTGETKKMPVTLTGFNWQLLIDGKETVSGNLEDEIEIKTVTVIPIRINLDFFRYFPEFNQENMMKLAFSFKDYLDEITLKANPVAETEIGNLIKEEVIIVDKEFR